MQNLEGWAISKERSSKGRSSHADGPTTEKALRCIIAKRARGTKTSPLAAGRSTRRAAKTDTGQWAAEVVEVRGGAAKDTTGDHCSDPILYPLRYRRPMEYITHVGSDGRKLGQPPNKTGSRTQNSVQPSKGTKRKPSQQRTAAVNTAGYKCVDKGKSGLVGERSGNHPKLM